MKRNIKKLLLFTVLLLTVGMMLGAFSSASAKTKKLKTKTIKAGKSVNLKVKGKAKWKISNAAVARMTVLNSNTAKVTGLQKGKTVITAKVKKTKYKATINVKSSPKSATSSSTQVESLSSSKIKGSPDSTYYINIGEEVVGHFDDSFANSIVSKTNSYRSKKKKGSLTNNSVLTAAARVRAVESAWFEEPYDHTRPNGKQYYTVGGTKAKNYKDSPVYGENLAWGFSNAAETLEGWIGSKSHRDNLERDFVSIGVAVFMAKQADGSYCAYIAQEFGR